MQIPLYTIDAFTKSPFTGNSAAICLPGARVLTEKAMQGLAAEMNISETAYIELLDSTQSYETGERFKLRWFTPTNEVALCGHATLAAAAVLFYEQENVNAQVLFSTLSGDLKAKKEQDKIVLDFPSNTPDLLTTPDDWNHTLTAVLGEKLSKRVESVSIASTVKKMLVKLHDDCSLDDLKSITPDFEKMLKSHDGSVCKGVIVTMRGNGDYDFFSRYFAPWNGINEDPVTGSAHTALAPFWGKLLGKKEMRARQCSNRGGDVDVVIRDDGRIELLGSAVTVISGCVTIPDSM